MKLMFPLHVRDLRISDPYILADHESGYYYTYARTINPHMFPGQKMDEGCFHAIKSQDLINWSEPFLVFQQGSFWADLDYWAPECHQWRGKYYLISSFRRKGSYRRCQCLVADSPEGPFRPVEEEPVTPNGWHCLDGTLYEDLNGRPWMVFCHEWLQVFDGQMAAIPLSEDLGSSVGEPHILFYASEAPWGNALVGTQGGGGFVTDGPFLYRMKTGTLVMLWSNFTKYGYATGYARSLSGDILGPWIQEPEPLYAHDGAHSMLFRHFGGDLMMSLHCPNIHPEKRMLLFEMDEDGDHLRIRNEVTGNWYTTIRGTAQDYRYRDECIEAPCFRVSPCHSRFVPSDEAE